jgi:hypothetical protein
MNAREGDSQGSLYRAAIERALQQHGWTLGRTLQIDYRWGAGDAEVYRRYHPRFQWQNGARSWGSSLLALSRFAIGQDITIASRLRLPVAAGTLISKWPNLHPISAALVRCRRARNQRDDGPRVTRARGEHGQLGVRKL